MISTCCVLLALVMGRVPECLSGDTNRQLCPLQCKCTQGADGWIRAVCPGSDFTSVPQFPDNTRSVRIQSDSKLRVIQSDAFANLKHLENLYLSSTVPWSVSVSAFQSLHLLKGLHMKGLHKPDLPEDIFDGLEALHSIVLSLEYVTIPHQQICKLQHLSVLNLAHNKLRSVTFHQCFSFLTNLNVLTFTENSIGILSGKEFQALKFVSVKKLSLDKCELSELGPNTFRYLKSITSLTLTSNKLSTLPPGLFDGMRNLSQLNIGGNRFEHMPCGALDSIHSLVFFTLDRNKMKTVNLCPGFRKWTSLTKLKMDGVAVSHMDTDFFQNLTNSNLSHLHLTVRKASPRALTPLKHLKHLSLWGGIQNASLLHEVVQGLSGTKLVSIAITGMNLPGFKDTPVFQPLEHSELTSLAIRTCLLTAVSKQSFSVLRKLEVLDLSGNRITDFPADTFKNLVTLKVLLLGENLINSVSGGLWGIQPSLLKLSVVHNNIRHLQEYSFKCLVNLERLSLEHNEIKNLPPIVFNGTALINLNLSSNKLTKVSNEIFNSIDHIEELTMDNNLFVLTDTFNPKSPFAHLKNVRTLSLSGMHMQSNYQCFSMLFNGLSKLEYLTMTNWGLDTLPLLLFVGTNNLDILKLSNNQIASWDPKMFEPLAKLTLLMLHKNKIASITKEAFTYLPNLRQLDLSDNALACNCELMWFREWIETAFIYLPNIYDKKHYHCESPEKFKGVAFLDFNLPKVDCISFSLIKLSVTFSTILVLVLIAAGLVYRYRFEVQMFMFYVRSRQQRLLDGAQTAEYLYDAYVIYSGIDRRWVCDKLLPALETNRGYRLCIEDRDWLAGIAKVDNIIESIETSRKVILVLSKHFSEDNWCIEMAEMAQSHLLSRSHNALIPILLTDVPPGNMRSALRTVFATRTLLPWPKNQGNMRKQERLEKQFWKSLNTALKKRARISSPEPPQACDSGPASASSI